MPRRLSFRLNSGLEYQWPIKPQANFRRLEGLHDGGVALLPTSFSCYAAENNLPAILVELQGPHQRVVAVVHELHVVAVALAQEGHC